VTALPGCVTALAGGGGAARVLGVDLGRDLSQPYARPAARDSAAAAIAKRSRAASSSASIPFPRPLGAVAQKVVSSSFGRQEARLTTMNAIDVSPTDADSGAMVAALLCRVREVQGLPAALDLARAMIIGGASSRVNVAPIMRARCST
jgi:hypothetical protein